MIRLIDINGLTHYLAPQSIASIVEAGASSQWHGIRAYVRTTNGKTIEARETADQIATMIAAGAEKLIALQAEIDAHEIANGNLFALVNELRELLQDAKRALSELQLAAIPDESTEGVPAIIPPEAFRKFVDAHARLCFLMHQRGHNPAQEGQRNG
ncbi:hypothetical protein DBR12_05375 [Acidovorax sp. HMWF029]|uniref:hypothetical protein n=1 Tax=Acidovorax sp. HMWF029 TaxID=2056863 RepID=UPI000D395FAE|nr:hypothetical protein [Acidovorax sp. HMWF029]PTT21851.1 hypothetical protein DBR12_05375 [Acidovorax sp. HMWF029]